MMNEKMTIEQQVAQLTPQQKKNIRIYEIVSGSITFLCAIPLLIYFFFKFYAALNTHASSSAYLLAKTDFQNACIIVFSVLVAYAILYAVVFFAVIKKKMPYYSMKKAAYLLTHFKA